MSFPPFSWRARSGPALAALGLAVGCLGCPTESDVVRAFVTPGTHALAPGAQARYFVAGQEASSWAAPATLPPVEVRLEENTAPGVVQVHDVSPEGVHVQGLTEGEATLHLWARFPHGEAYRLTHALRVERAHGAVLDLASPCAVPAERAPRVMAGARFGVTLELRSAEGAALEVGGLPAPVEVSPPGALELLTVGQPAPVSGEPVQEHPGMQLQVRAGLQPGAAALRASVDGTRLDVQVTGVTELDALGVRSPSEKFPIDTPSNGPLTLELHAAGQPVCGEPRAEDLSLRSDTPAVCSLVPGRDDGTPPHFYALAPGECRVSVALPAARGGSGLEVSLRLVLR